MVRIRKFSYPRNDSRAARISCIGCSRILISKRKMRMRSQDTGEKGTPTPMRMRCCWPRIYDRRREFPGSYVGWRLKSFSHQFADFLTFMKELWVFLDAFKQHFEQTIPRSSAICSCMSVYILIPSALPVIVTQLRDPTTNGKMMDHTARGVDYIT